MSYVAGHVTVISVTAVTLLTSLTITLTDRHLGSKLLRWQTSLCATSTDKATRYPAELRLLAADGLGRLEGLLRPRSSIDNDDILDAFASSLTRLRCHHSAAIIKISTPKKDVRISSYRSEEKAHIKPVTPVYEIRYISCWSSSFAPISELWLDHSSPPSRIQLNHSFFPSGTALQSLLPFILDSSSDTIT